MRTDSREYIVARKWDEKGYEGGYVQYVQREAVTRCRDCKHFNDGDCEEMPKIVSEMDFCSFGERRSE